MDGATNNLVIGLGQIGTAIREIIGCDGMDIEMLPERAQYDVLHICFPYSDTFIKSVREYQATYNPKLTIIHSTVPIGTSKILNAVHSPVRGIHPNLKEGILWFDKFFGGEQAAEAAALFDKYINAPCHTTENSDNTEAMKLWDTTQYGWNIIIQKAIYNHCEKNGLDFDVVYTTANQTYNYGYERLNKPQYKKYVLTHSEGPIGGHCIMPNLDLLGTEIADVIKEFNGKL